MGDRGKALRSERAARVGDRFRVGVAALLVLFSCAAAWPASEGSRMLPLWEVRDAASGEARLWLLGSVHMRDGGDGGLDARIEESLRRAEVLAVELDPQDRGAELAVRTAVLGVYPDGSTVWDHLEPEVHDGVRLALAKLPAGPLRPERMRPWLLALTLAVARMKECGLSNLTGVEVLLLRRARGAKRVVELETVETQLQAFAGLGDEAQAALLLDTVAHLDGVCADAEALIDAWAAGDAERVESLTAEKFAGDPALRPAYESILLNRNRTLADAVEGLLDSGEPTLAVVGVGHLVGEEGVVERLRARGHPVTQLEAAGAAVPAPAEVAAIPETSAVEVFEGGSFTVEMPGTPSVQRLPLPGTQAEATLYLRQLPDGSAYSVTVLPLPRVPPAEKVRELLERSADQVLGLLAVTGVEKRESGTTGGHPSLECVASFDGGSLHFKVILAETGLYQVSAVRQGEAAPLDPARFVGSFRFAP